MKRWNLFSAGKDRAGRAASRLAFQGGSYSLAVAAILLAILIAVNVLVSALPASMTRYDISASKLYSITSNTKVAPGSHGSTFWGNPVCCAGTLTVLERLSDDFLAQVTAKGAWVRSQLEGAPGVVSVSGLGLMLGVETRRDAGEVLAGCQARGVLPLRAKNKVRLLPPLNIPDNLLAQAVQVLREECAKQI